MSRSTDCGNMTNRIYRTSTDNELERWNGGRGHRRTDEGERAARLHPSHAPLFLVRKVLAEGELQVNAFPAHLVGAPGNGVWVRECPRNFSDGNFPSLVHCRTKVSLLQSTAIRRYFNVNTEPNRNRLATAPFTLPAW